MTGPVVRVAADAGGLVRLAAEEVAARAGDAVRERGRFTLALSGGATPRPLYELLADPGAPFGARVPWGETHLLFGDERCVPPDHPESNFGMVRRALLDRIAVPAGNVHRMRGEDPDPAAAAARYEEELREISPGEPGPWPRLDLVLLGLGADGHTASLFPGSPALDERRRWVVAPWVEHLGARRLTLTLPVLQAARAVLFLVAGAGKAARVAQILEGDGGQLPAARVRLAEGDLLWLLDADAAAGLRAAPRRT